MRTLAEISKDIANTNKILSQEIESVPYSQKSAVQINMIQASERLPKIMEEIKELVIPHKLVGLFASGDQVSMDKAAEFLVKNSRK